jgi:uncharacterized protein
VASSCVRTVAWTKDDPPGAEWCRVELGTDSLRARGTAIGFVPVGYRFDYELETTTGWVTTRLVATTEGEGWSRRLELRRDPDGTWHADTAAVGALAGDPPGCDVGILAGSDDVDLQYSPLTNLMPARRLGLDRVGTSGEFTMAWVSVPDLAVHADGQRYTIVPPSPDGSPCARFDAVDESFAAVIAYDADGLAVDYPGIARRVVR